MTTPPRAVAIYARISSDTEGTGLGVKRQVQDCRRLAGQLGWPVADEYVDNDVSAYSGKRRPEYERMLADISEGAADGVLVYHIDRLTRRPIELEQFLAVVDAAKVKHVKFVTGDTDLNTGDGLLVARMLAAVAANESASKSRRVKRKLEQNALEGKPHGGARAYGYAPDHVTVVPEEAALIRDMAARYLAGESLWALTIWLNENAIPATWGPRWRSNRLRDILRSPRIAGLRTHHGEVVGTGLWEPIITEETHRRLLAKMAQQAVSDRRTPTRNLLTGLLTCSKCGNRLSSSLRGTTRRYACIVGPDHGGCGGITVVADPLERFLADAVLYRLDTPELADTLAGRSANDEKTEALTQAIEDAEQRLEDLARAHGNGDISMREWMTARKPIQDRLTTAQRQMTRITHTDSLRGLIGTGDELRRSWADRSFDQQRAILAAVIDHAEIKPGTPGIQKFDPNRVAVVWRT